MTICCCCYLYSTIGIIFLQSIKRQIIGTHPTYINHISTLYPLPQHIPKLSYTEYHPYISLNLIVHDTFIIKRICTILTRLPLTSIYRPSQKSSILVVYFISPFCLQPVKFVAKIFHIFWFSIMWQKT